MLIPDARMLVHPGAWNALNIQAVRPVASAAKGRRRAPGGRPERGARRNA
jgi:hypothetical protein